MVKKAVILAGGYGTRISEESHLKPKPMIEIGGKPILWHILKIYSAHGINDFVICGGYKDYVIKEYFANYFLHTSDVTFDTVQNKIDIHYRRAEPWRVTLVDTGLDTMTGGRLKRVREYLDDGPFCMTYGDGLSDVDIREVIAFHGKQGTLATVTAIQPRRGSARCRSATGRCMPSRRNRKATATGSTAASSCSSRR
jgi:glucose-1-phosphate cytidylyltransferase